MIMIEETKLSTNGSHQTNDEAASQGDSNAILCWLAERETSTNTSPPRRPPRVTLTIRLISQAPLS